jgi:fatty acid desaturase
MNVELNSQPNEPEARAPDDRRLPSSFVPIPQFRLRTLLLLMAVCGALFALVQAIGMLMSLVLLVAIGLVAAHVIGNALGTRLRGEAARRSSMDEATEEPPPVSGTVPMRPIASKLTEHRRLPRRLLAIAGIWAVMGGIVGGGLITAFAWQDITVAGVALGIGSSAVLGGLAGFLASSFFTVARAAWREALGEPPQRAKPR